MKRVFILLFILNFVVPVFAGNFAQELNNSIARAKSGSIVQYTLHFPDGKAQLFTGADFTSGRVIDQGGAPSSFELFNGTFEKKYNIIISLQNAIYYKLDIEKVDGKWEYKFHFYY